MSGVGFMVLAVLGFVVQDAAVKWLTGGYTVAEILLLRCLITLGVVGLAAGATSFQQLRTRQLRLHLARGLMLLASAGTFFFAFSRLPLADAYTIFYMAPLAMTVFAALLLREKVPRRAAWAIALGLLGVGIVVAPQVEGGTLAAYLACVAGTVTYSLVGVMTRRLAIEETPLALLFYPCLVMSACTAPLAAWAWVTPGPADAGVFVVIGLLWPIATWFFAAALKRAPVARLAPIEYSSIVWVVAIDYFAFATTPATTTLVGSAVIIVACMLLVERRP
ncbi:MAG: DMT family transporter [Alphaproteobacteria bacterium]|nr:DMT family transporter [Alphaproteobacteria bacterium]